MPSTSICLFFSDTGGGHRSAALAISQGLADLSEQIEEGVERPEILCENIVEKSHPLNRYFVDMYNFLLRHCQAGMKYYYWAIENFKPNDSQVGYRLARPYLFELLDELDADVIVSIHPMSNHYLAKALTEMGRKDKTKLVTVVTDPNGDFWRGWACPDVDLTLVPNDLGRDRLLYWGIEPEKIKVTGMPVHPDFLKPSVCPPADFKKHLGLDPVNKKTICINAGWAGGGNMLPIYKALEAVASEIQVVFICGHNIALYERIKKESVLSPIPTAVLPFHDRMADLMSAVDLMVTKAGGLTTFESVARRLPMAIDVITPPMPQEEGTVNLLCNNKLAKPVKKPEDIVTIVKELDRKRLDLPDVCSLNRVDAVYDISTAILELAGYKMQPELHKLIQFNSGQI
ncbi:MAG: glycosyltransferase [Cyanobacteriota/Melainabacteria group bacterium]|nr:hypothetical protein [Cyanobacteria bacterium HKST-UBA01]